MSFEVSVLILVAIAISAGLVGIAITGPRLRTAIRRTDAVWLDLLHELAQERAALVADRIQWEEGTRFEKRPITSVKPTLH